MAKNKGKKFEDLVAESCDLLNIQAIRLKDGSSRSAKDEYGRPVQIRLKTNNPSDFILFDGHVQLFLECKSYTDRIPFGDLRQMEPMSKLKDIHNMQMGFLIEITHKDRYIIKYISYGTMLSFMNSCGKKSINFDDVERIGETVYRFLPSSRSKKYRINIDKLMECIREVEECHI